MLCSLGKLVPAGKVVVDCSNIAAADDRRKAVDRIASDAER